MGYKLKRRDHEFGTQSCIFIGENDYVVADKYADQYSINWTTRLSPAHFVSIWNAAGKNSDAIFAILDKDDYLIELPGYQLAERARRGDFRWGTVSLVRYWFDDASVAWQFLPTGNGSANVALTGVASNVLDLDGITFYLQQTISEAPVDFSSVAFQHLTDGWDFRKATLRSLQQADYRRVDEAQKRYG